MSNNNLLLFQESDLGEPFELSIEVYTGRSVSADDYLIDFNSRHLEIALIDDNFLIFWFRLVLLHRIIIN